MKADLPKLARSPKGNKSAAIPVSFPIVGIGASAGGLEAFTELLQSLPADTGLGFVLIQHLDPTHESSLAKILSKATPMPLVEVENNTRVEPNHVYVIPPNAQMTINQGVIKLVPGPRDVGVQHSIDSFFQSLAHNCGTEAIGVVLSGSASDGTIGLEEIKNEGGITFAQDEKSARFASMPRSAVAAGCVDFILPPARIAQELAKIAAHTRLLPRVKEAGDGAKPDGNYQKILNLLRTRTGVDLALYKPKTLQRRMSRRMVLNKVPSLASYASFLREHPHEIEALYQDVLISVTSFFRDPELFEQLKQKIFPRLVKNRTPDQPVRIWVLGCSTGQEVYSLAMAFLEFASKASTQIPLQVFATDLNETVLEKARVGLYAKSQVQNLSPQRLRRFFVEEDGGWRICKSIREMCVFARHDVLIDPPFSRMDLLSCRNVMIYLEPVLQKRLIPVFHYALKPKGILVLGSSESLGALSDLFTIESKKHKIFSKTAAVPRAQLTLPRKPTPQKPGRAEKPRPVTSHLASEMDAQKEADRIALAKYAPAGVLVNEGMEILQFRGQTSPYLEPTPGRASLNLLKMLREGLLLPVRAAIQNAKKRGESVRTENIEFRNDHQTRRINLEIVPLKNLKERCYLVLFEPAAQHDGAVGKVSRRTEPPLAPALRDVVRENARLRNELAAAKEYLQSVTEQYEAVNEELQAANEEGESSNEELQSINEELETTKEELESTNEELTTVNEEMNHRNVELHRMNNDLNNVLTGVQMCIVVVGGDLCIRRFTPLAEKLFNLVPTDVGRPITNIKPNLELPDLDDLIAETIRSVRPTEQEVRDKRGRWHSLRILPYKTSDNRIDGAVLVLVDVDALKRSEQQIKAARDYAESTLDAIRDPWLILDRDLRVESANPAFYKTFKAYPAETLRQSIFEIAGGQWNIPQLRTLLEGVLPRNSFFDDFEVEHDFERIGRRSMLVSARPIVGDEEASQRILLSIEDVTERKKFEVLRESEHRFRTLADTLPQLVWTCPPDGECDYFNTRWSEYTGVEREKLIGDGWRETLSPLDRERTCDYWIEALKGTVPYDLEYRIRRADGAYHWFKVRANPVRDAQGQIVKWFGTCTDIEDQKQAQRTVEQSEKWLRLIMESVKDFAIFALDEQGRIVDWNPGAEQVFGYSASEILEKPAAILYTPEDRENHVFEKELAVASASGCSLDERWHVGKNGEHLFMSGAMRAIRDETGALRGFTKVSRDMTERKRHEQELQSAHEDLERRVAERTSSLGETVQELEAFSYSISHDLRAPLRAMLGFANLALSEGGEGLNAAGRHAIERIIVAAKRLDRLILDLLAFSRVTRAEVRLTPVDLEKLVHEVIQQYPGFNSPEVTMDIQSPLLPVMGHEGYLIQCLSNLLTNAIKFMRPGTNPYVRIWTEAVDGDVKLYVADNGIGIEPANISRIFGMFERLHSVDKYEGTGVGLAIVQKAAERMGGTVGVESRPGEGSTFWIQLRSAA